MVDLGHILVEKKYILGKKKKLVDLGHILAEKKYILGNFFYLIYTFFDQYVSQINQKMRLAPMELKQLMVVWVQTVC